MVKFDLENEMNNNLVKEVSNTELTKVADLIENAMNIFEKCGMHEQNEQLIKFLNKFARKNSPDDLLSEFDRVVDEEGIDDLLASDIEGDTNKDPDIQTDFEDE